jgi:hypothetical protein
MKLKIIIAEIVFFVLLFFLKFIFCTQCDEGVERVFYIQSSIEILLKLLLLLLLSVVLCCFILKSRRMIYTSFWIALSLCFLFEISKYIKHLFGFLPYYGDVPLSISILLSFVTAFIYAFIMCLLCLFIKKIKK